MTEKAWLRAVAGSSLLKLCYIQKYSQMVGIDLFATLATLMIVRPTMPYDVTSECGLGAASRALFLG